MRKTYTYKQVLFALREEYIYIQNQVSKLEEYVEKNKKISDYKFILDFNKISKEPRLLLEFEFKKNLITNLANSLVGRTDNNVYGFELTYGFKERYECNRSEDCDCFFKIKSEDELNTRIFKLVQSDYIKEKIKNKEYILPVEMNGEKYFSFNWNQGTRIIDAKDPYYPQLNYNIINDLIYYKNSNGISNNNFIDMLNYPINISKFNNYYQEILDRYLDKEVVVDADLSGNDILLSIVDNQKDDVLVNKK